MGFLGLEEPLMAEVCSMDGLTIFGFYGRVLSYKEIDDAFGDGFGDFGAVPDFSAVDRSPLSMPMPVTLVFRDHVGTPVGEADLMHPIWSVVGASVDQFVLPHPLIPLRAECHEEAPKNSRFHTCCSGRDDQNITTSAGEMVVVYGDIVTSSEDLVGWWNFDQHQILQDANSDFNASWTPADLSNPPVLWLMEMTPRAMTPPAIS